MSQEYLSIKQKQQLLNYNMSIGETKNEIVKTNSNIDINNLSLKQKQQLINYNNEMNNSIKEIKTEQVESSRNYSCSIL